MKRNRIFYFLTSILCATLLTASFLTPRAYASSSIERTMDNKTEDAINIIFVGDYVTEGMKGVAGGGETETWITESDKGLVWLKSVEQKIKPKSGTAIVISIGFNEVSSTSKAYDYVAYINGAAEKWVKKGAQVYYDFVTPVDESKYGAKLNDKIKAWNEIMEKGLSEDVICVDTYSIIENRLVTKNDGYHYTKEVYKALYDYNLHNIGVLTPEEREELNAENSKPQQVIVTNGWGVDKDGYRVYYDGKQNIVVGWKEIEGGKYYFDENGHYVTGLQKIKGKTYYFNSIGLMRTGLCKIDEHFSLFGEDGAMLDGWQEYKGERYYVGTDGWCLTGWWTLGTRVYYFHPDGAAAHGITKVDDDTYCFGDDGAVMVGWQEVENQKYYFLDGGKMAVGKTTINDDTYYFNSDGVYITGWSAESDGMRYYGKDGIMVTGFTTIDDKHYFFALGGLMQTGWFDFEQGRRYFTETGAMAIGERHVDDDLYYFDEEGYMLTGIIEYPDGTSRFFDDDGKMKTGWQTNGGEEYYVAEDGTLVTGIKLIKSRICIFEDDGSLGFSFSLLMILFVFMIASLCVAGTYYKKHPEKLAAILEVVIEKLEGEKTEEKTENKSGKNNSAIVYEGDDEIIED